MRSVVNHNILVKFLLLCFININRLYRLWPSMEVCLTGTRLCFRYFLCLKQLISPVKKCVLFYSPLTFLVFKIKKNNVLILSSTEEGGLYAAASRHTVGSQWIVMGGRKGRPRTRPPLPGGRRRGLEGEVVQRVQTGCCEYTCIMGSCENSCIMGDIEFS